MTNIREAVDALETALKTVPGLRVYQEPGANITGTQSAVIALPTVVWGAFRAEPTEASIIVHLIVPMDEYITARLYDLVEPVVAAIENDPAFAVTSASPGLFMSGKTQLPSYALTVEVGL